MHILFLILDLLRWIIDLGFITAGSYSTGAKDWKASYTLLLSTLWTTEYFFAIRVFVPPAVEGKGKTHRRVLAEAEDVNYSCMDQLPVIWTVTKDDEISNQSPDIVIEKRG